VSRDPAAARLAELCRRIAAYRRAGARVAGYRVNLSQGRSAVLGLHDNEIGSVYAPLGLHSGVRGHFLLVWSDGLVSRGQFDGAWEEEIEGALEVAHETRYRDDESRQLPGRARPLATPVYSAATAGLLDRRIGFLYDVLGLVRDRAKRHRVRRTSGSVRAGRAWSAVASSRGLRYAAEHTEFTYSYAFDGELWDGHSRRRPYTLGEIAAQIERTAALLAPLRRQARGFSGGVLPVLFHPNFAEELIEAYVVSNLMGSQVATGQSAWGPDLFAARKRVFRDDLAVAVDPTRPYAPGSFRMSAEGLPARPTTYIAGGRLLRPIVGLKFARRLKLKPTTPPASMDSVVYGGRASRTLQAVSAAMGEGLLIYSALGLHTQDAVSGDYSLTAPQAIVVRSGDYVGKAKVVFSGNAFEQLRSDRLQFVRFPGYRALGLLVEAHVTVE